MSDRLDGADLRLLVERVFRPTAADRGLAILADVPDEKTPDNPAWRQRRALALEWANLLAGEKEKLALAAVSLAWFRNSGSNNADLPPTFVHGTGTIVPMSFSDIESRPAVPFRELFDSHSLVLAPTEFSTTAPLKMATRGQPFRAATMPGFLAEMIPALKIDYGEVNRRVDLLKSLCDRAEQARLRFRSPIREHTLTLDLRFRTAHASGGLFPQNGAAGNLPSGEAYIVPYEGENPQEPSRSAGELPVQIGQEVVLYEIKGNRAVSVLSTGPESDDQRRRILEEPAYANLAELGLGVLTDFGLKPVGSILLDEKLGLHIAFGRSDHFGGTVRPADFSRPDAVIHLDRVYIPESQPAIQVLEVCLDGPDGETAIIIDGSYGNLFD